MTTVRQTILDLFTAPFRPRREVLDRRTLSIHMQRDLGLLDGHTPSGSIR